MKRFKDFAKEENLDGDKAKLDFILGKEIIVTDYQLTNSKFANNNRMCLKLQFELEGERYIVFTGSMVLARQAEKYKDEMPFATTIKKIDQYYTMT